MRHSGRVLAIILASYVMIMLDVSIVLTSLPKIRESLAFSAAGLSWVHSAYTLTFGGLLLLGARAGDILGRRRMMSIGLGLFTVTSLVIGLAPSAAWLIGARALQGVGAAILAPSTLALLTTHFPEGPARTRAVSFYAAVAGVGASVGLVLGGVMASWLSWRVGFLINVPLGIGLLVAARSTLAETSPRPGAFDLPGALSSTLGMFALVFAIVRIGTTGVRDPLTVGVLATGIVLLTLFVVIERRSRQPVMPLGLFASRERAGAYAARLLFQGGMVGFWFYTTQFLQGVLGFSPLAAGVAFLATTLPNFASALLMPVLTRRFGRDAVLVAGLAVSVIGMAWLSRSSGVTAFFPGIMLPMVLVGLGQGGTLGPLTAAGIAGVGGEDAGAASGLVNVAHQLGCALGLGILVVVFAAANGAGLDEDVLLAHRIAAAYAGATVMVVIALGLSVVSVRGRLSAPLHSPIAGSSTSRPLATMCGDAFSNRAQLFQRRMASSLAAGRIRSAFSYASIASVIHSCTLCRAPGARLRSWARARRSAIRPP